MENMPEVRARRTKSRAIATPCGMQKYKTINKTADRVHIRLIDDRRPSQSLVKMIRGITGQNKEKFRFQAY